MRGIILLLPQYAVMEWCSVKAQGHFTFYLYLTFRYMYITRTKQKTTEEYFRQRCVEKPLSQVEMKTEYIFCSTIYTLCNGWLFICSNTCYGTPKFSILSTNVYHWIL